MYEQLLEQACEATHVPGAVLAIATGEGVEVAAAGLAAVATGEPMTPHHQFPPMSITKSMTAVIALELSKEGTLALGTPIGDVLPGSGAAPWSSQVSVDRLLACTGGMPAFHFPDTGAGEDAVSRFAETVGELALVHPPGARFSYSNTGFAIVGAALEAVTNTPYDDLVEEFVLRPLGMTDTGSWYRGEPALPVTQHFVAPDGAAVPGGWWKLRSCGAAGSGTMYSTAADLARYGRAHIATWPELRESLASFPGPHAESWGRGWAIYGWGGGVFGWDGFGPGAKTFLRGFPEHDAAIALLTNASNGREVYRRVLGDIVRERFGLRVAPEAWNAVEGSSIEGADQVVGRYRNGAAVAAVVADEGRYLLTDSMGRRLRLDPVGDGRYNAPPAFDYPAVEWDADGLAYFCSAWVPES